MSIPSVAVAFAGPRHAINLGPAAAFGLVEADFTVEAWVRLDTLDGDAPVLGTDERSPNTGLHLSVRDGRPYLGFYENDTAAPVRLQVGTWHHLAWRYAAERGEQAIFLDGVRVASATGRAPFQGRGDLWVGRWGKRRWLHGAIADLRIWEEALSERHIHEAARGETSPEGALCWLRADGPPVLPPGAAPRLDVPPLRSAGPAALPTPPVLASPTLGLPARALRVRGGAWLALPYAPTLGLTRGDFTVTSWVRLRGVGRGDQVILGGRTARPQRGLHLVVRDGKPYFGFYAMDLAGRTSLEAERWTHLTWCYDATAGVMRLYVDGQLDAEAAARAPYLGNGRIDLGRFPGRRPLDADVASLRVWRTALEPSQIEHDAAGRAAGADDSLVAAWELTEDGRFDDISGLDLLAEPHGALVGIEGPGHMVASPVVEPPAVEPPAVEPPVVEPPAVEPPVVVTPPPAPTDPLDALAAQIQAAPRPVALAKLVPGESGRFLADLPGGLSLGEVETRREGDRLEVAGEVEILGATANAAISLTRADGGVSLVWLDVSMGSGFRFEIPGLPWFALERVGLRWDRSGGKATGRLRGVVIAGGDSVEFALPLPLPDDEIVLALAGETALAGMDALAGLLGGGEALGLLAEGMEAGRSLGLKRLDLRVGRDGLRGVDVGFATEATLTLVPGALKVGGLRVELSVERPLDRAARSLWGEIAARLDVAEVEIPLVLGRKAGQGAWRLGLAAEASYELPSLTDLAEAVGLPGELLPEGLGALAVVLDDVYAEIELDRKKIRDVSVSLRTARPWSFLGVTVEQVEASLGVSDPMARARQLSGQIRGRLRWAGANFEIMASRDATWQVNGGLVDGQSLTPRAMVDAALPDGLPVPEALEQLAVTAAEVEADGGTGALRVYARVEGDWTLDVGPAGLTLRDLMFKIERPSRNAPVAVLISGVFDVDGVAVRVHGALGASMTLRAEIERLNLGAALRQLCDAAELVGLSVPGVDLDLNLRDVRLSIGGGAFGLRANADGFGFVALAIAKNREARWGAHLALRPAGSWQLSSISSVLSPLDGLDLAGSVLLLSSNSGGDVVISELPELPARLARRGLTVIAVLNLLGTGVDRLTGLHAVEASVSVGADPRNTSIAARLGGDISLGGGVTLVQPRLEILLQPPAFAVAVAMNVLVELSGSTLTFVGAMMVSPGGATFAATMLGAWREPFGLSRVEVADVALELGINFGGVPTVGLAGRMRVGASDGRIAVKFDSTRPSRSMLVVGFTTLKPLDVLATLCEAVVSVSLPAGLRDLADAVVFSDCELYVVPEPTTIGALAFEAGTRVKGGIKVLGYGGRASAEIAPTGGMRISGALDPIRVAGVFGITDASGATGPSLDIDLRPGARPSGRFSGKAWLLGWSNTVEVDVTPTRQHLRMEGSARVCKYALDVTLTSSGLEASGSARFAVLADIGPFSFRVPVLPAVDLDFLDPIWDGAEIPAVSFDVTVVPNIHLDFGFKGDFSLSASAERFALGLAGGVWWDGHELSMPDLALDVAPSDLEALPGLLVDHIADNAEEIFARLFAVVEDFADMVLREAEAFARKVWSEVSELGAQVGAEIVRLGEEAVAFASRAAEEAARIAAAAAAEAAALAAEAARYASQLALEVARIGQEAAAQVAALAAEAAAAAQRLANEAVAIANAAAAEATRIANEAAAQVANIGQGALVAANAVAAAGETAAREIAAQAETVAREAEAAANTVKDGMETAARETADFAVNSAGAVASAGEAVGRFAEKTGGEIRDGVVYVSGQVVSGLSTAGNAIVGGAEWLGGQIVGGLGSVGDALDPTGW